MQSEVCCPLNLKSDYSRRKVMKLKSNQLCGSSTKIKILNYGWFFGRPKSNSSDEIENQSLHDTILLTSAEHSAPIAQSAMQ